MAQERLEKSPSKRRVQANLSDQQNNSNEEAIIRQHGDVSVLFAETTNQPSAIIGGYSNGSLTTQQKNKAKGLKAGRAASLEPQSKSQLNNRNDGQATTARNKNPQTGSVGSKLNKANLG